MKKKYNMKRTISMGMFISEFGEAFTSQIKLRLMDIGERCVLIRKENGHSFDLKHVEHTKHNLDNTENEFKIKLKEYTYGQISVSEEKLYFSCEHKEGNDAVQLPAIEDIYEAMDSREELVDGNMKAKIVGDANIDYLVDNLLKVCPPLSQEYLRIISKYKA